MICLQYFQKRRLRWWSLMTLWSNCFNGLLSVLTIQLLFERPIFLLQMMSSCSMASSHNTSLLPYASKCRFPTGAVKKEMLCLCKTATWWARIKILIDLKIVVGVKAASYSTIRRWHSQFKTEKRGNNTDKQNERLKSASNDSNVSAVARLVKEDPHVCKREVSARLSLSFATIQRNLHSP